MAAGQAVRSNAYVQRLIEDEELRANLRTAFDSAKRAYGRMNGKGPTKALEDKKVQQELTRPPLPCARRRTVCAAEEAQSGGVAGCSSSASSAAALALALSEGLRKKVLDALFGAEEEFEYTATHHAGGLANASATPGQPVGTT